MTAMPAAPSPARAAPPAAALLAGVLGLCAAVPAKEPAMPRVLKRQAHETLTAVELDRGETLELTLRSGQLRRLTVLATAAAIIERVRPGGVVYHFTCRVRVDGREMTLQRYVCSQECFYEPYVVNGVRIWLDAVSDIVAMIPMRSMETQRAPHKHARLAVQDAALPICPQEMQPWYPNRKHVIDVGDCYNGDDCWLGPYLGRACHGGLDINHPKGDPLWAPIDFDDQWLFNSLAAGHNNNRWRGVRKWPGGDLWTLQTHHLVKLLVREHTPVKAGTKYASAAGVYVGSHQHTHYVFKVTPSQGPPEIHLDPWILFWQIFETARAKAGEIHAAMRPLAPARTGREVRFRPDDSRSGPRGAKLRHFWTFGDGGWSAAARPTHTFTKPGVYPVTLVVDDGQARASTTQHVTVAGPAGTAAALALAAPDEPAFGPRPVGAMDVYGQPVRIVPHTLRFVARPSGHKPRARTVRLQNAGGGELPKAAAAKIEYVGAGGWLRVAPAGTGNRQSLTVAADPAGLKAGRYEAVVRVACKGAINSPQGFRVELLVRPRPRATIFLVDDRDEGFYATPCFWVGHQFCRCKRRGHRGRYLTNGSRPAKGEFVRFTPDLAAGLYDVSFHEDTPFPARTRFRVRVRHKGGDNVRHVTPYRSRRIGTFEFDEGADGFVEIPAAGSTGLVLADAVVFRRVESSALGPPARAR